MKHGVHHVGNGSAISNPPPFLAFLFFWHAQQKYDHRDVQSESNSDDNAQGILQLLAWMLVHKFPRAALGILEVIDGHVISSFLLFYYFRGGTCVSRTDLYARLCSLFN